MTIEQDMQQLENSVKYLEEYVNQGVRNNNQEEEILSKIDEADAAFDRIITEYINISERPSLEQARFVSDLQERLHRVKHSLPARPLGQERIDIRTDKGVIIYTTPACPWCHRTKEYLSRKGIIYTEHNVATNRDKAKEMIEKSGANSAPDF